MFAVLNKQVTLWYTSEYYLADQTEGEYNLYKCMNCEKHVCETYEAYVCVMLGRFMLCVGHITYVIPTLLPCASWLSVPFTNGFSFASAVSIHFLELDEIRSTMDTWVIKGIRKNLHLMQNVFEKGSHGADIVCRKGGIPVSMRKVGPNW